LERLQREFVRDEDQRGKYAIVTLHRPSNVDNKEILGEILDALIEISRDLNIIFPVHPRTKKNLETFDLLRRLKSASIELMPPLSYMDFLRVWKDAEIVLTDSGGLQEETTALGIPCFTLRDNTERPITVSEGTNRLVGNQKKSIMRAYATYRNNGKRKPRIPDLWDGRAGERIADILLNGR
jgi:UDP-N-acetylglucosamine 2-epimerase (non-hydrolysing)